MPLYLNFFHFGFQHCFLIPKDYSNSKITYENLGICLFHMTSSMLRNSPSPPPHSPITEPNNSPLPNSPPCSVPPSSNELISSPMVNSTSLALPQNITTPTTLVTNPSVPPPLFSHPTDTNPLQAFDLHGQKFRSVHENFHHIRQQPAQNRWSLTEKVPQYRSTVVR